MSSSNLLTPSLIGAPVYDASGAELGKVKEIEGACFKVDAPAERDYWLPADCIHQSSGGAVQLAFDSTGLNSYKLTGPDAYDPERMTSTELKAHDIPRTTTPPAATPTPRAGTETEEQRTLRLREEQLRARKETVEAGEVGIRKEVVTEQQAIDVPVTREEVYVERRTVDARPSDKPIGEGETITVPIREERVTADKQTYVTGEVEIGKRSVQETERVEGEVRREEARIEREGDVDVDIRDSGATDQPPQQRPQQQPPRQR